MGRIRTVKPDLFRHEGLQELQADTNLPVMLVFIGLFTQVDREGRFKWSPRTLKLDILPFLEFSMEDTLQLLAKAGFIRRYEVEGKQYGDVPSWSRHQVVNAREAQSVIPPFDGACMCTHVQEDEESMHAGGEGNRKGREEEKENTLAQPSLSELELVPPEKPRFTDADIETIYQAYPRKIGKGDALKAIKNALKRIDSETPAQDLLAIVKEFAQSPAGQKGDYTPYPASWFNAKRYLDDPDEWEGDRRNGRSNGRLSTFEQLQG
jgi:hypothetical protein